MKHSSDNYTYLLVTVSIATALIVVFIKLTRKRQKYILPSGPSGVPILGNILSLVKTPLHLKLTEWAPQFGGIYTIHLGPKPAVVVNDIAKMKELFGIFPASTGKLLTDVFKLPFGGKYGFLVQDGHGWAEQRQFCVKNLRTFGYGKGSTMEPMIIDEVNDLMAWLQKEGVDGHPVLVLPELQKTTFNTLWRLITGEKIPEGNTRFVTLMENFMAAVQNSVNTGLAFIPWLKHVAPEKSGYNWIYKASTDVNRYINELFEQHHASFQEGSTRDLIDAFLEEMRKEKDPRSSFYGEDGWKHAVGSISALFFGGGETTATTLTWLIFYLCCEPEVQRKLQEEIDRVIGKDREPMLKDRLNMPYTEAVITETLRKSTFLPFGIIHELTEDTRFQEYSLPKGALLIANLYHAHYNQTTWGDPEVFKPERFLTGDKMKENVVAFQVGKRICPGEGFARDAMFLFVVKLFQKFNFSTAPGIGEAEYLTPDAGLCILTRRLPVVVTPRFVSRQSECYQDL